jgi:hypothetical protein
MSCEEVLNLYNYNSFSFDLLVTWTLSTRKRVRRPTILYPTFPQKQMKINVFPKKAPLLKDPLKRLKLTNQKLSCLINCLFFLDFSWNHKH